MPARGYEFYLRDDKIRIHKRACNILFIIQTPMKYQETISWTNPLFAESCIIKYRSYAHSYFSREKENK